jgi:alpha-galactosidase
MGQKPKIVIIGAGSAIFGLSMIKDAFSTKELWGSELVFVDIDRPAVEKMATAAQRINRHLNAGYAISFTTDRTEALPGADFVITSIAVDRVPLWKQDFHIPKKHGIQHVLGENAGPGAVFHTMRNIPIILGICRDIEQLCPDALLINFTNPESRICLAIHQYTNVKAVGLCHQIHEGIRIVATLLGKNPQDLDVKAWGINHLTWMVDIRDKETGEDLYPLLREKEKDYDPAFEKLSRFVFRHFGLFPTSGDDHLGEFFPYAHEMMGTEGYDFAHYESRRRNTAQVIDGIVNGTVPIDNRLISPSVEAAFDIIKGMTCNTNELILSANVPNQGYIRNLPEDAIVEIPVIVSGNGINGLSLGELPQGIASLCSAQIHVQQLAVAAGVEGDKNLAIQALLTDPNVPSAKAALNLFDELMEVNRPYLPQFFETA